jgi:hypothetical protein
VTPNDPSTVSRQQDPDSQLDEEPAPRPADCPDPNAIRLAGIFAYLLAAYAQRAAIGASDRPKLALAILAIDANSWGEGAHDARADRVGGG